MGVIAKIFIVMGVIAVRILLGGYCYGGYCYGVIVMGVIVMGVIQS